MTIKFGTDGWRAVISEDFTFANVRKVAQAIAEKTIEDAATRQPNGKVGSPPWIVVGYDTRFPQRSLCHGRGRSPGCQRRPGLAVTGRRAHPHY